VSSANGTADALAVVPEGTAPPPAIAPRVFDAAAQAYATGQRLDMLALCRRLGISRATLYRRAGNREQLLDQVLWWRARRTLAEQAQATAGQRGAARIVAAIGGVLHAIERDKALRALLESDPETALRLLTGTRSAVQQGMVAALERLIDLERGRGAFAAGLDTPTLAYAIVRIAEGFLYADVVADRTPDIDRAITLIAALLRGLDQTPRSGP
jgi:AcrR family transcriptional regulator